MRSDFVERVVREFIKSRPVEPVQYVGTWKPRVPATLPPFLCRVCRTRSRLMGLHIGSALYHRAIINPSVPCRECEREHRGAVSIVSPETGDLSLVAGGEIGIVRQDRTGGGE